MKVNQIVDRLIQKSMVTTTFDLQVSTIDKIIKHIDDCYKDRIMQAINFIRKPKIRGRVYVK